MDITQKVAVVLAPMKVIEGEGGQTRLTKSDPKGFWNRILAGLSRISAELVWAAA